MLQFKVEQTLGINLEKNISEQFIFAWKTRNDSFVVLKQFLSKIENRFSSVIKPVFLQNRFFRKLYLKPVFG